MEQESETVGAVAA